MPILVPGSALDDERLAAVIRDHRETILEVVEWARDPPADARPPLSLLTMTDLGRDLVALCDLALAPGAPRPLKESVADVSYDGALALIDLMKVHSDLPKVPRSKKAPA